jgi:hypothetical protein
MSRIDNHSGCWILGVLEECDIGEIGQIYRIDGLAAFDPAHEINSAEDLSNVSTALLENNAARIVLAPCLPPRLSQQSNQRAVCAKIQDQRLPVGAMWLTRLRSKIVNFDDVPIRLHPFGRIDRDGELVFITGVGRKFEPGEPNRGADQDRDANPALISPPLRRPVGQPIQPLDAPRSRRVGRHDLRISPVEWPRLKSLNRPPYPGGRANEIDDPGRLAALPLDQALDLSKSAPLELEIIIDDMCLRSLTGFGKLIHAVEGRPRMASSTRPFPAPTPSRRRG